ncbi:MAG: transporter substrate-binding domain-containing protein, partial [Bacteroidales bacterium]|nr:transporter substrate-binding domain-containing protein [Bacteroidales bacterium]
MENVKYFFKRLVFIFLGVYIILFNSCNHSLKKEEGKIANDFNVIKERGKIIAVTQYNSTDYFIYKGEPMGYQLELLQLLSDYLNMQLEVIVRNDLDENFRCLEEGGCDLLAINLTVNKPRNKKVNFTLPIG